MQKCIVAIVQCKEGMRDEAIRMLGPLEKGSRAEEGNLQYDITEADNAPGTFYIIERWQSEEAIAFHCTTPHYLEYKAKQDQVIAKSTVQLLSPLQ